MLSFTEFQNHDHTVHSFVGSNGTLCLPSEELPSQKSNVDFNHPKGSSSSQESLLLPPPINWLKDAEDKNDTIRSGISLEDTFHLYNLQLSPKFDILTRGTSFLSMKKLSEKKDASGDMHKQQQNYYSGSDSSQDSLFLPPPIDWQKRAFPAIQTNSEARNEGDFHTFDEASVKGLFPSAPSPEYKFQPLSPEIMKPAGQQHIYNSNE